MCAKPASPLGEKHIFENQSVKLGLYHNIAKRVSIVNGQEVIGG